MLQWRSLELSTQLGGNKLSKDCTQQKLKIYGDHSLPEIINSFGIDFNVADVSVVDDVVVDDVVVALVIGWIWDFSSTFPNRALIDGAARIFPTSTDMTGNWTHVS